MVYQVFVEGQSVGSATSIQQAHDLAAKMAFQLGYGNLGKTKFPGTAKWDAIDEHGYRAGGGSLAGIPGNGRG